MDNQFRDDYTSQYSNQNDSESESKETSTDNYQDFTSQTDYTETDNTTPPKKSSGFQIASLVLGILGIIICCCYGIPSIILGILGLIFAIVGNKKNGSNGIGTAGLVCSIIAILLGVVATVYFSLILCGMYAHSGPFSDIFSNPEYEEILRQFSDL